MAGALQGFDPDAFIAGIHSAMEMGLSPDPALQPIFCFKTPVVPDSGPVDLAGAAWSPAQTTSSGPDRQVAGVMCAIEFADAAGNPSSLGVADAARAVITLLGDDYQQVVGFDYVVIGGCRFNYRSTNPPLGISTVAVWQVHVVAVDMP